MVYVFLADGFEEVEALTPIDYMRRCDIPVAVVGVRAKLVRGAHGIVVMADTLLHEIDLSKAEMLVLPGGMPGTLNLEKSGQLSDAIDYAAEHKIHLAAICAAPSILGHKGLLKQKQAICFEGYESQLKGATISSAPCVTDGLITTAKSAAFADQFSFELVRILCGEQRMKKLKESLLCDR